MSIMLFILGALMFLLVEQLLEQPGPGFDDIPGASTGYNPDCL